MTERLYEHIVDYAITPPNAMMGGLAWVHLTHADGVFVAIESDTRECGLGCDDLPDRLDEAIRERAARD